MADTTQTTEQQDPRYDSPLEKQLTDFLNDVPPPAAEVTDPPAEGGTPPPEGAPPVIPEGFERLRDELFDEAARGGITPENFMAEIKKRMSSGGATPSTSVREDVDEEVLRQSAFIKSTGIRNYDLYSRVTAPDKSTMAPIDWALLGFELDYAERGIELTPQVRERRREQILKSYGLVEDEDNPVDPVDKQMGEANLAFDAKKVEEKVKGILSKVEEQVPDRTKTETEFKENASLWDNAIASEVTKKDNRKISIKIDMGADQALKGEVEVDFEIPEADYINYLKGFGEFAKNTWKFGDYQSELKNNLEQKAWAQHKTTILKAFAKMVSEKTQAALVGDATNTTPAGSAPKPDTVTKTFDPKDPEQVLEKWAELNKN